MNTVHLFEQPASSRLRHGGVTEAVRRYLLLINGTEIEEIRDDNPATGYAKGRDLDRHIGERIDLFERALGCKATRGKTRDPNSTATGPFARYRELKALGRPLTDSETMELNEIMMVLDAQDDRGDALAQVRETLRSPR